MKVKKGDDVVVIGGKDRGKKGKVIRVVCGKRGKGNIEDKVVVEKVNLLTKYEKSKKGGGQKVQFEAPVSASKVKLICPETGKSTRVGYQIDKNGKKYRVAKVSGVNIEKPFVRS
jgi:large subunit ribosomal protein L24